MVEQVGERDDRDPVAVSLGCVAEDDHVFEARGSAHDDMTVSSRADVVITERAPESVS